MKRQIKFRGKRLDNLEWVYGGISIFENEATIFDVNDMTNSAYEVDIDTVGQYIGLNALNNVEIFEDDLVSLGDDIYDENGMPDIKEILFDEDSTSFRLYDYLYYQGSALAEKWFIDDVIDSIKVIGNIHDNPELLEDKKIE